jgi:hypothetical protein
MKNHIPISKNQGIGLIILYVSVLIIAFLFLRKNYLGHRSEIKDFISKEINGKIDKLEDNGRGTYTLGIENVEVPGLPIAFEVHKYNIQIGDSISKQSYSPKIKFYKSERGVFVYLFEFEIR